MVFHLDMLTTKMGYIPILKINITQVQKEPAKYRSFISIMGLSIIEPFMDCGP